MRYLSELCDSEESAIYTENGDIDMKVLFKEAELCCDNGASVYERLINYMQAMREYCKKRLFIIIGANAFFDDNARENFFKNIQYEKIDILFIGDKAFEKNEYIKEYIIDRDLCEIYND